MRRASNDRRPTFTFLPMTMNPHHEIITLTPLRADRSRSSLKRRFHLLCFAVVSAFGVATNGVNALPTFYTVGDSTVQNWNSGYYPKAGWGQVLPKFFDSTRVNVVNKAVGGTSSKSFYDLYWSGVRSSLVAGDYVFVQFGINDSATDSARHTDASTTFKDYLRKYVDETKARGAFPVIVATLRRNAWNSDGVTVYDAYHGYPIAAREVAAEKNVPCVDLDGMCKTLMESLGKTYCTYYWYMNLASGEWPNYSSGQADNVHFQEAGAIEMARLVTTAIRSSTYTSMQNLVPALRPAATVTFSQNNANGVVTRTQAFPSGLTMTAMARPDSGQSFLSWSGSFSSTRRIAQFTMGTAAMSVTGNFSGGTTIPPGSYQAESGTLSGGASAASANTGYYGSGYADFPTTGGACTLSNVDGGSGGAKIVSIRYANGSGAARTGAIVINGVSTSLTFPATSSWTTWAILDVTATLNGGTSNTIAFQSTGQDLANVDQIVLSDAPVAGDTYQAESAALGGGSFLETTNTGYHGSGYVNFPTTGGTLTFSNVDGNGGGAKSLAIRYANGSGATRTGTIVVNGVSSSITFPATASWTAWTSLNVNITLNNSATNTIVLQSTGQDLANVDEIAVP